MRSVMGESIVRSVRGSVRSRGGARGVEGGGGGWHAQKNT